MTIKKKVIYPSRHKITSIEPLNTKPTVAVFKVGDDKVIVERRTIVNVAKTVITIMLNWSFLLI